MWCSFLSCVAMAAITAAVYSNHTENVKHVTSCVSEDISQERTQKRVRGVDVKAFIIYIEVESLMSIIDCETCVFNEKIRQNISVLLTWNSLSLSAWRCFPRLCGPLRYTNGRQSTPRQPVFYFFTSSRELLISALFSFLSQTN